MPWLDVLWDEQNLSKIASHGLTPDEVRYVLEHPRHYATSRSSGRPLAFGYTERGRFIGVVYEQIDEVTVYPVTAYDVED